MTPTFASRPLVAGALAFSAATAMTSAAAIAACGGAPTLVALAGLVGPPSITATEASTDQALELIRKRREEASGSCPAGFVRSGGNCIPANATQASFPAPVTAQAPAVTAPPPAPVTVTTTTTTGAQTPAPASAPAASQKQRVARATAQGQVSAPAASPSYGAGSTGYSGGSIKDGPLDLAMPGTLRARGVWVEGYYDEEKHSNLNPGRDINPSRRMVSGGVIAGADVSEYSTGGMLRGWQFGVFGGHNSTRAKFSDTLGGKEQSNGSVEQTLTTNQRQEFDGGFGGLYGAMAHGAFSADVAVKFDALNMSQQLTETLVNCANVPVSRFNDTSMTNFIVASNANYRINLTGNHYLEPTVGIRYTHTDFGGNAAALGVRDGDAFRVQGGLRLGTRFITPDGWIWNTSVTGLLYSDVSLDGFVLNNGAGLIPSARLVDEGRVFGMGILESRVDIGAGYSFYGAAEYRGGQDMHGFGARGGIRYQW